MARGAARRRPVRRALLVVALAGVLPAGWAAPAQAQFTFTVNSTGDESDLNTSNGRCDTSPATGRQCSLRAAIEEANATPAENVIVFNIVSPASVKTISPGSALPAITHPVTIDGYSQSGASPNTLAIGNDAVLKIQLNGSNAGTGANGLTVQSFATRITGLIINRFSGDGIELGLGTIGNRIEGNFIGTNASGTRDLGNTREGVEVNGSINTVGGDSPAVRNVLSGNDLRGVFIADADGTKVEGNYVGTDATGTRALGNTFQGVNTAGPNTVIGGASGAGNLISGNGSTGIIITVATGNVVEGNRIGTKADGTGDLGNGGNGLSITSNQNTIGGTTGGAGNLVSGNDLDGVNIFANGNTVQNNAIRANDSNGVELFGSHGNDVMGNVIFANGENGVAVTTPSSVGNSIMTNQIFANGDLGIDLAGGTEDIFGVTANDTDDPDGGANNLQNFPVINSAVRSSSQHFTTITGTLNSKPSQSFTIQCFVAEGEPSNHGEGQFFVGETSATTDANGDSSFTCVSSMPQSGQEVSATATNSASGETSEFSLNRTVVPGP